MSIMYKTVATAEEPMIYTLITLTSGQRQMSFENNWQDGVPGVSQCPITASRVWTSQKMEYRSLAAFSVLYIRVSSDSVWSILVSEQFCIAIFVNSSFARRWLMFVLDPAGLYGALGIGGPAGWGCSVGVGPLLISDWFHQSPFSLFYEELCCGEPVSNSHLLQGQGVYYNETTGVRSGSSYSLGVAKGKKYKISLVNAGTSTQFTFWIDGHTFTVVGTDFVPIKDCETDTLNIAVGQRYDIFIKENADSSHGTNFWIHARDCNSPKQISTLGIFRYDQASTELPADSRDNRSNFGCLEPSTKNLIPVVSKKVEKPINGITPDQFLNISLQPYRRMDPNTHPLKWSLKNYPMYLDWSVPSLKLIQDNFDTSGIPFHKIM
ncbi:hypothetical protein BPOR_0414g00070 [Botrytis porri]|uniref:Plastocyanin-like domain-containing protein n=1 Tax=Botrytis porri TaxID=87229 RepID=A0A4Z1KS43_9HELO|nr:hypothetical protein BPOR_0414g00070 [Botrytis porri]